MRVLYLDIDSLRHDHLGCYGYPRDTSPAIDAIARRGVRFSNCYASDVPCLPSRTSLSYGRLGIHHGAIDHSGDRAEPFPQLRGRGSLESAFSGTSLPAVLKKLGYRTVTFSSFAERHAAWHFLAGYDEFYNTGGKGHEIAHEVTTPAIDWLQRNGSKDDWFLHVQLWDVHIPYRTPDTFGHRFSETSPVWLSDELRQSHWQQPGIRSAQDMLSVAATDPDQYPQQPRQMDSMEQVQRMINGYDTAIRYADEHIGLLLSELDELGVLSETIVVVSADHGEGLGELNSYCGHQLADEATSHVPLIIAWPGIGEERKGAVVSGLSYQLDLSATLVHLLGGTPPAEWDANSLVPQLTGDHDQNREYLVITQAAQAAQRSVRFRYQGAEYLLIRTYHDAFHGFPDVMLFDVGTDPHEVNDLSTSRHDATLHGLELLKRWRQEMLASSPVGVDPLDSVVSDLPQGVWGRLDWYLERLRATDRDEWAHALARRHLV